MKQSPSSAHADILASLSEAHTALRALAHLLGEIQSGVSEHEPQHGLAVIGGVFAEHHAELAALALEYSQHVGAQ